MKTVARTLMQCFLMLSLFLAGWAGAQAGEQPRAYRAGSLAQIAQARQGKPFVVLLWSLECSVCMKELDFLAKTLREHPGMDMVLISTDEASAGGEASSVLELHGLGKAESWIFAEDDAQRLRYEIDPAWYGELPRAYFYDAAHKRIAVSGAVEKSHFDAWLAAGK
ncbi:TlpA family protein disulfide reductase [Methylogaea oryzae]|uniref:Thioredoxin domain-containing protein n=1 Tax=Methylogaea oryzae TaxID=1295382 RepID=A0A8D4VLP1_9GAMM|nr:hypothetical protein [Methylogaea oryzae]BBL69549.1 hypothetical protein MoryE10_01550 [Methylogaea oryzae]